MHTTIVQAIRQRQGLSVFYDGYLRTVEPHVYGINSAGHEALSCYQISGGSSSGATEGWKMLLVPKLKTINMTEQKFSPRSTPSPWSKTPMRVIYAQV